MQVTKDWVVRAGRINSTAGLDVDVIVVDGTVLIAFISS